MTKKSQPWMIFQPEGARVFYFWNGEFPVLIKNFEGNPKQYYWHGLDPKDLSAEEKTLLNNFASSTRRKTFTIPGKTINRFRVVERGVFENHKT